MSIENAPFPDAFWGISRRRDTVSENPLFNPSSVFYRTEIEREKERRSQEGKREICRPSAAVPPPSLAAVCHFRGRFIFYFEFVYVWDGYPAVVLAILGWGPKSKARRTVSASSSSTSYSQSTEKEIELQAKLHEALERIEVQDRNHQALASQVKSMKKMIKELTRAQQGPPHDP
ncbi:hypothetical protein E5676_scaffold1121G00240 [Cucumis melo var. makuwa]|uniref:CACTA en-spm transposon protein n=1 Tax=Cucumis melo var. makuwa TaxID=1194695 RepID=A0A5D3CS76_CUCMM|nr:hypothetical protein E5676_scaffold1121G00240 [Cucumis melo var. makuwa]